MRIIRQDANGLYIIFAEAIYRPVFPREYSHVFECRW
jgi:hypothetical protein